MAERHITALIGSYRKGGIIDQAVDEILAAAAAEGAETRKIFLLDRRIEFCANCRNCTQEAGIDRGPCAIADEMGPLLDALERSDAFVLASPVNFGTVTALMKRFIERLACFAFWPWGAMGPQVRNPLKQKRAVLVVSSAAPAFLTRLTTRAAGLLKQAAGVLGARTVGVLFIGLAARRPFQEIGERTRRKARRLGKQLAR